MIRKLILHLSIAVFLLSIANTSVHAQDITVTCDSSDCVMTPSAGTALFGEFEDLNYDIKPGDNITRRITVTNNADKVCNFSISSATINTQTPTNFAQNLYTSILLNGNDIFGISNSGVATQARTLSDIFTAAPIYLSSIDAFSSKQFTWLISFDKTKGNEFQNARIEFDFDMNFSCEGQEEQQTDLLLFKSNNSTSPEVTGNQVIFTLTLQAQNNVNNVGVTDLMPEDFKYVAGSWTASSNFRGDLRSSSVTTEPTYASPGDWYVGNMLAGEEVVLTYTADITSTAEPGIYKDLAWAQGDFIESRVLANDDRGIFVGTQVEVIEPETYEKADVEVDTIEEEIIEETGDVLGTSTSILPETGGSNLLFIVFVFTGLLLGFSFIYKNKIINKILLLVLFGTFFFGNNVFASNTLSVRLEEPELYTNTSFNITFVALDIDNNPIDVTCYKKGPSDSSFIAYLGPISLQNGGDSDYCKVTSSILNSSGSYDFKAVADNGITTVDSPVVTTNYSTENPSKPKDFEKEKKSSCSYKLSFKTADDGRTEYVYIYRSTSKSFEVSPSTEVKIISTSPNTNEEFTDTVSGADCSKDNYYAIRSADLFGNFSDVVTEPDITITKIKTSNSNSSSITSTQSSGTEALLSTAGGTITDSTNSDNGDVVVSDSTSDSENTDTDLNSNDESTSGDVLGEQTETVRPWYFNIWIYILSGSVIVLLLFLGFLKNRSTE